MRSTLTTERLTLRPLTFDDAAWFSSYAGAPEIARMTGSVTTPLPLLSAEFWIMHKLSRVQRGLAYPYVMELGGEPIGMIDAFKRGPDAALELGYSMMPDYWGHGYMYEACEAVIAEAASRLGAARIIAGVFTDNPASLRLLRKLGFTAARSHEQWFSMGRMEKAKGVTLTLDIKAGQTLYEPRAGEIGSNPPSPIEETAPACSHDLLAPDKIAMRA